MSAILNSGLPVVANSPCSAYFSAFVESVEYLHTLYFRGTHLFVEAARAVAKCRKLCLKLTLQHLQCAFGVVQLFSVCSVLTDKFLEASLLHLRLFYLLSCGGNLCLYVRPAVGDALACGSKPYGAKCQLHSVDESGLLPFLQHGALFGIESHDLSGFQCRYGYFGSLECSCCVKFVVFAVACSHYRSCCQKCYYLCFHDCLFYLLSLCYMPVCGE